MSTVTQHAAGMFCWTQLGTSNPNAAIKFYGGLFGWTPDQASVGDGPKFNLLKKDGKIVGMVHDLVPQQREQGVGPNWLSFVATDSVDTITEKVKQAGGKVLMGPADRERNGRMAVCQDPTGAVFALWQAGTQPGAEVVNEPGAMCWNELITNDTSKAGPFYQHVFGWKLEPMPMPDGSNRTYTIFKQHEAQAGGMMQATPEMKLTHPYWMTYFAVDDADESVARARQLGGKVAMPPTDIPNIGRFAVLIDPQGAYFSILAMPKQR